MRFNKFVLPVAVALFLSCHSNSTNSPVDTAKSDSLYPPKNHATATPATNSNPSFEDKVYLKIDKIYSGSVYTNKAGHDVFYRILEIPEEENTLLIAENISIGDEGGNYQLIKRVNLNEVLTRHGSLTVDSLKFIDSVNIQGYFNDKKMIVNLDKQE